MNILFWTELFFPHIGGIEVFGAQLIKALSRLGHKIKVVASHSGIRLPDISEHEGIEIHRFHFQRALVRKNLQEIKRISEKIIRFKIEFRPDVVHINTIQPSLFFFYHTRNYHPAPTLFTLHQPPSESSGRNSLFHNTAFCSDWITAVSKNLLSKAVYYVPEIECKSSVLYNGLESPPAPPSLPDFKHPTVLCMGRLIRDKGFDLALASLKDVISYIPRANLIIAGDGPQRKELEESAERHGIRHAVRFTGWVSPDEVYEVIDKASLLAAPSRWE